MVDIGDGPPAMWLLGFLVGALLGCSAPLQQVAVVQMVAPTTDNVAAGDPASDGEISRKVSAPPAPDEGTAMKTGTAGVVGSFATAYADMWTTSPLMEWLRAGAVTMRNTTPGGATPTGCSSTGPTNVGTLGAA